MNTNCVVHFDTRTLVVSRSFLKKASVPFSNEYHMMKSLTEADRKSTRLNSSH